MGSEYYGYTCDKCPSRGCREVVGDHAPVRGFQPIHSPQGRFTDDGISHEVQESVIRWVPIGFPDRCKECDGRYKRAKRAREAILRLEYVRMAKTMDARWLIGDSHEAEASSDAERWKYLRFITLTWPLKWSSQKEPDLDGAMKRYVKARTHLANALDIRGGTDVMECVTKVRYSITTKRPSYQHNIHFHGVWVMPYHPVEKISEEMRLAGVGRDQVRVIRPKEYECRYTSETRTQTAISRAVNYLSKYLTKEVMGNRRRIAWGEMRRWKDFIPAFFKCEHNTTTYSIGRCECFNNDAE